MSLLEKSMKIIKPSIKLESNINELDVYKTIEMAGRIAYKSEDLISDDSWMRFINIILSKKHESVLEHISLSFRIICDRGVSHELVRHRIASYTQESTRYCNYSKDKFGNELTFIKPIFFESDSEEYLMWCDQMRDIEWTYMKMIEKGVKPEQARCVLPISIKTEILMTMNLRSWINFIKLRCDETAHPQMREISHMILTILNEKLPKIFNTYYEQFLGVKNV